MCDKCVHTRERKGVCKDPLAEIVYNAILAVKVTLHFVAAHGNDIEPLGSRSNLERP
jgi:hypothetical protein